jgi:hypothetical protein
MVGSITITFSTFVLIYGSLAVVLVCAYRALVRPSTKEMFESNGFNRPWIEWAALGVVFTILSGLSASSRRMVPGAMTALSEPQPASALKRSNAGTGSFIAHVGKGTIELVAVGTGDSHYPSTNSFDWWKPDGKPIERLRYQYPPGGSSSFAGNLIYRQLIFRTGGLPPGTSIVNISEMDSAKTFSCVGSAYLDGKVQPDVILGDLELPAGTATGRIKVAIAIEPWFNGHPITRVFRPGGSGGLSFDHEGIQWRLKLQDIEESDNAIKVIAFHTVRKDWQSELVMMDLDGKEWFPQGTSESFEGLVHLSGTCNLPLSRIKEAYLRVRPCQSVEFRNVSLVRGQYTDVGVVEPDKTMIAKSLPVAPSKTNAAQIDEAAQVKLKFAEERVKEAEAKSAAGVIGRLDYEKEIAARDILLAEMKGDAVESARIKLRITQLEFSAVEQAHANGVVSEEEYKDARLARDLAAISLQKLQDNASNSGGIDEAARVKLKYAEEKVKEAENWSAIGAIDSLSLEKIVADRDIIIAEMRGDAVEVARIKLKVAESEFSVAERKRANGVASTEEYNNAKLARDLAAISLRQLLKAKGE